MKEEREKEMTEHGSANWVMALVSVFFLNGATWIEEIIGFLLAVRERNSCVPHILTYSGLIRMPERMKRDGNLIEDSDLKKTKQGHKQVKGWTNQS